MTECKRCLIVSSGREPEIDSSGICTYCRTIEEYADVLATIGTRPELLYERLSKIKGQGKYDCLVGFSGGKDSSYVIYNLQSRYGARVLTYTLDNGFMAPYGRDNINRLVEELQLDHRWVRPDDRVLQAMMSRSLKDDCWPCSACFHMVEASTWKIAYENRIPFIVHGRIPEQILRNPKPESFAFPDSLIGDNLSPYDPQRVRDLAGRMLQRFAYNRQWLLPNRRLWPKAAETLYLADDCTIPNDFAPELLGFFLYEEYDEARIMDFLEKETSWQRPDKTAPLSHADCLAHDAAGYLYYHHHQKQFYTLEISALVRHGKMTRDEARQALDQALEELAVFPQESIDLLSEVSGLTPKQLRRLPSWIHLRERLKRPFKKILGRA